MDLRDRRVLLTGAGGGIGAALAEALVAAGAAALALAEHPDAPPLPLPATAPGAAAPILVDLRGDLADPAVPARLVTEAQGAIGPLDLVVANAGVPGGGGLDAGEAVWDLAWQVNAMAHVRLARAALPALLEQAAASGRPSGFVAVASAAGLLTNLGNAPYSVTKHAAVAFAEWLAITHGPGLDVACVCPMGVDTAMLRAGAGELSGASVTALGVLDPAEAARRVVEGLQAGRFLVLTHPEVAEFEQHRTADRDRWLAGMRRAQDAVLAGLAGPSRAQERTSEQEQP